MTKMNPLRGLGPQNADASSTSSDQGTLPRDDGETADAPVSREHVHWAYRVLLDREPENDEIVQAWFDRGLTAKELRSNFISSVEFRLKNPQSSRSTWKDVKGGSFWRAFGSIYVGARSILEQALSHLSSVFRTDQASPIVRGPARFARRPRVLLVTPYAVYPPNHGGGVRLYNLIKRLSSDVDIHLVVFSTAGDDESQRRALGHYCAGIFFHHWKPELRPDRFGLKPPSFQILWSEEAADLIREILRERKIDIVQLEYSELGQYANIVPKDIPVILTAHDVTFRSHKRRLRLGFNNRYPESRSYCGSAADLRRIFLREITACRSVDMIHVMSQVDGNYLARFLFDGWRRLRVVPNGVDCDGYAPQPNDPQRRGVLFVGYFQNLPNQDALEFFVTEIWPTVRRQCPEATLTVVGSGADARTRRCTGSNGIRLVGEVDSVAPYYRSHRVMVVPIRAGSGTRLKVLEAFAAGIPVVSTRIGAEGILAEDDRHLLLADDAEKFAASILRLLNDADVHQRIAAEALDLARDRYDWGWVAEEVLSTYSEILDGHLESSQTRRTGARRLKPKSKIVCEADQALVLSPTECAQNDGADVNPEPRRPRVRNLGELAPSKRCARLSVLLLGVYLAHRPNNVQDIVSVIGKARETDVDQRWVALLGQPPSDAVANVTTEVFLHRLPKLEIVNSLISGVDLQSYDYVVLCDDDVVLPHDFLDRFLSIQDRLGYSIAQPARTNNSFIDLPIVEQHPGLLARQTLFVEQGPVVSFHASTFDFVFPFDLTSPMGWGLENIWSLRVSERGLKMGIVDAVPVDHSIRKPVAHYSWDEADRGRTDLLARTAHRPTEECFRVIDIVQLDEDLP